MLDLAAGTGKLTRALAHHARGPFGALLGEQFDNDHRTSRDGIVAMIGSFSSIGALPPERAAAALDACREALERHGVDEITLTYRTLVTSAQLKPVV